MAGLFKNGPRRLFTRNPAQGVLILPMEIKARDLDPRLYLALKGVRPGIPCIIGHYAEIMRHVLPHLHCPFVYLDKGRPPKAGCWDFVAQHGGKLAILDEEGGIFANEDIEAQIRYHPFNTGPASLVLLWGERQREVIRKFYPETDQTQLVVAGNPRFDLRKPDFDQFYRSVSRHQRLKTPYVLINTVFEFFNHFNKNAAYSYEEEVLAEVGDNGGNQTIQLRRAMHDYQEKLAHLFVGMVRYLAAECKDMHIVLRPHPVEDTAFYTDRLDDLPNVLVTKQGSVQEWIVDATAVVHHDCTTAVEAFLNQKPVFSFAPIMETELVQDLPVLISDKVTSEEELAGRIASIRQGTYAPDEAEAKMEAVRQFIANVDFDAAERIAPLLAELFANGDFPERTVPAPRQYSLLRKALYHVKQAMLHPKTLLPSPPGQDRIKFPDLPPDEMHAKIKALCRAAPSLPNVRHERLASRTYLLESDTSR